MSIRLFDGHCDTAFELFRKGEGLKENTCHISLSKASAFSAYAQVFAFCSLSGIDALPWTAEELLLRPFQTLKKELGAHSDRICFASNRTQILSCHEKGKIAALLSVEGPEVIGCDPERLQWLFDQGFIMTTLTWNANNALAGFHGGDKGLSDRGRAFIKNAQELGLLIDVSHLSEVSFWELVEMTDAPILASHSNCRALCEHSRNLTDDQLRLIAQSGGTVGLNLYPPFLGENADFETLYRHLEHMLQLCGEKHVALGGDLDGCEALAKSFSDLRGYSSFYGFLQNKGYSQELLDDIFYYNLLRLL